MFSHTVSFLAILILALSPAQATSTAVAAVVGSITVLPPILLLSVSDNPQGTLAVEVLDTAGNPITPKSVLFSSSNPNVATVSDAGVVTAIAPPQDFGSTPYVTAIVDGVPAENSVVVRVTQRSLGLTLDPFWGRHVAFYVPREPISGFNYQQILRDYDVVRITDIGYELEWEASGVIPFNGNTQFLVNDPGHGADGTVPCGNSGNPIRLGSDVDKPGDNSCMIVAAGSGSPQWGVFLHEMRHNFLGEGGLKINQFMSGHSNDFAYSEGLATSLGMYAAKMMEERSSSYKIPHNILDNLVSSVWHFGSTPDLDQYVGSGAHYGQMTPSVLDDMIDTICSQYGYGSLYRFYSLFVPHNRAFPFAVDSDVNQATLFVAALSAATGVDLRARFKEWGFPVDDAFYRNVWSDVNRLVSQRVHGPEVMLFKPRIDGLTVTVNGVTLPGTPDVKVTRTYWDWGDGQSEDTLFPASHAYGSGGGYTITVIAYQSDGLSTTRSVTVTVSSGAEKLEISDVDYPISVKVRETFVVDVQINYSLSTSKSVTVDIYENAGPLLASRNHFLSGSGTKIFDLSVTVPDASMDSWQLNIHLQGDYKRSIYIRVEPDHGPTKVKVYVYAIDDSNRQHSYNIQDVAKIAGAQIRVEYPGSSQVLTTGSGYPGPYVEVDQNTEVTVAFVQNPPGWIFAGHWDIYTISWTAGDSRTFNVGTSDKHVSASFNPVSPETSSYWAWGVIVVALVMLVVVSVIFKLRRRPIPQPQPKEILEEAGLFDVLVSVPSVRRTVTLEVAPDHTVGSLVESVTSALDLPKGGAYAIEYAGKLINQADFGKSLESFGIKEGSKLSLRVVE